MLSNSRLSGRRRTNIASSGTPGSHEVDKQRQLAQRAAAASSSAADATEAAKEAMQLLTQVAQFTQKSQHAERQRGGRGGLAGGASDRPVPLEHMEVQLCLPCSLEFSDGAGRETSQDVEPLIFPKRAAKAEGGRRAARE